MGKTLKFIALFFQKYAFLPILTFVLIASCDETSGQPVWERKGSWDMEAIGSATFGDLNNDGVIDMIKGDLSGPAKAYENTGTNANPTWTRRAGWDPVDNGLNYLRPDLADLDCDGDLDLMVGSSSDNRINAIENTGTPSSPSWANNNSWDIGDGSFSSVIGSYSDPALVDLDDDGDYDILVYHDWGTCIAFENTGNTSSPTWTRKNGWDVGDGDTYGGVTHGDIDNDGDQDVLCAGHYDNVSPIFENVGDANSPSWNTRVDGWYPPGDYGGDPNYLNKNTDPRCDWYPPPIGAHVKPAFVDIDNDGDQDLFVGAKVSTSWPYYRVHAYENTGSSASPSWSRRSAWDPPQGDFGSYPAPDLADLDNDGDQDLLIGDQDFSGRCIAYENTGTAASPTWSNKDAWDVNTSDNYTTPHLGDLDNDGDLDLMVGTRGGILGYENTGTVNDPTWSAKAAWDINAGANDFHDVALVDIDNDGDLDIYATRTYDRDVRCWENTGSVNSPSWNRNASLDLQDRPYDDHGGIDFADLDDDGDQDAYLASLIPVARAFENTGNASSPSWGSNSNWDGPTSGGSRPAAELYDHDNDKYLDLLTGGYSTNDYAYENDQPTAPYEMPICGGGAVLPVRLVSFEGECRGEQGVYISWVTASESDNDHFRLEKSEQGYSYSLVDHIPGQGTTSDLTKYAYTDEAKGQQGVVYYRLVQVDENGRRTLHGPIAVSCSGKTEMSLYPNPAEDNFQLVLPDHQGPIDLRLFNAFGQQVFEKELSGKEARQVEVDVSSLPAGSYLLRLFREDGKAMGTRSLLIQ